MYIVHAETYSEGEVESDPLSIYMISGQRTSSQSHAVRNAVCPIGCQLTSFADIHSMRSLNLERPVRHKYPRTRYRVLVLLAQSHNVRSSYWPFHTKESL